MNRFMQLHLLTSYPPSNLNRDDLGRPKTAEMGGAQRLRVSSQSLKRAWRTSDVFADAVGNDETRVISIRTRKAGLELIYPSLVERGVTDERARFWASHIQFAYGEAESSNEDRPDAELNTRQIAAIHPAESRKLNSFLDEVANAEQGETPSERVETIEKLIDKYESASTKAKKNAAKALRKKLVEYLLSSEGTAADTALFGRMLASNPDLNVEAAAQVAHAITIHKVAVEDDFFTAVDDLNEGIEDVGAGHMGETEFGAGLFYLYICVDRQSLLKNLGGDDQLVRRTLAALVEAAVKVSPTGKQNSFASRAYASFALCETGDQQPRSLSVAFLKPVSGTNLLEDGIKRLRDTRERMNQVYGDCADRDCSFNAVSGKGSLSEVIECATK